MKNVAKAVVILNAKKGQAGWSEAARKKAAMVRKHKSPKKDLSSGMGRMPKKKVPGNSEQRRLTYKFSRGKKLIEDQSTRLEHYKEQANKLSKAGKHKQAAKYDDAHDRLSKMKSRNEKRLKRISTQMGWS